MAALGRLSVRHTLGPGRGAPVAESPRQDFERAYGRRRAFRGCRPSGQGHSAPGARISAGAAGREPARRKGVRSLRPQAHARNRDRDRRPARRFSGALGAFRSARHPRAPGRNRSARQRARLESRLDGRPRGPAALQRAGKLREARRARPRQDPRIRGAHRALRGEREGRQRRGQLGAGRDRAPRGRRREPLAVRLARSARRLENRSGPIRSRFRHPLLRQQRHRRDAVRQVRARAGRRGRHRPHREFLPRRRPGRLPLRSPAARTGRRVSQARTTSS